MEYELSHHTLEELCNCPMTLKSCEERSLKRKISDMEYILTLRGKEIQKLETEVRAARVECRKLCATRSELTLENNNLRNENQCVRDERQRLADQLDREVEPSENEEDPEEEEVQELGPEEVPTVANIAEPEKETTKENGVEASRVFTYSFEYNGSHW